MGPKKLIDENTLAMEIGQEYSLLLSKFGYAFRFLNYPGKKMKIIDFFLSNFKIVKLKKNVEFYMEFDKTVSSINIYAPISFSFFIY